MQKPTIALAMGDPAGISPELTARAAALPEVRDAARLIVIGDRRVFDEGMEIAKVKAEGVEFRDLKISDLSKIRRSHATRDGGQSAPAPAGARAAPPKRGALLARAPARWRKARGARTRADQHYDQAVGDGRAQRVEKPWARRSGGRTPTPTRASSFTRVFATPRARAESTSTGAECRSSRS